VKNPQQKSLWESKTFSRLNAFQQNLKKQLCRQMEILFYYKFTFVTKQKKNRGFVGFHLTEAPIFQNKRDTCLSVFQLIFFVEKIILSK